MDFQEENFVCGEFFMIWDSLIKKEISSFCMNKRTQRQTYLEKIIKLRKDNTNLVYLDETWVNAHHSNDYIWIDSDGKGGWKVPSGNGVRLIVLHAGGENG